MINNAKWTWSKRYAEYAPHWYILEHEYPALFFWLKREIEFDGENRRFRNTDKIFRYLVIGPDKFWVIGKVLNRAKANWY